MDESNTEEKPDDSPESGIEQVKRWWQKTTKDPNSMSFLEHLEEFRWVLIKGVLAFLVGCLSIGVFMGDTLTILREPLLKAIDRHGEVGKKLKKAGLGQYTEVFADEDVGLVDLTTVADNNDSDQLVIWGIEDQADQRQIIASFDPDDKDNQYLRALTPFAPITVFIQVLFLGGLSISLPFILYFVGQFVLPGLTAEEKKTLLPGCVASFFLFLAGACMTYFLILPLSLYFVMMWGNEFGMAWESGAGPYYTMVVWMTVAVGTSFEFPLVLKKYRSSLAQGVFLVRDAAALARRLEEIFTHSAYLDNIVLVQQFVAGPEYRIVASRDQVLLAYGKESGSAGADGDLNPLHQAEGRAVRVDNEALLQSMQTLTEQVAAVYTLGFYAIDLIDGADGFSILELNPNPMCSIYNRDNGRGDFIRLYERLLAEFVL